MAGKHHVSYRLTPEGWELLAGLARHFGITMTAVVEMLIRRSAREEGVATDAPKASTGKS